MINRGWDRPDFVYVTGDAYVDHSSFGPAVISRVLERFGYVTLVECRLETGRTHQIRVQFASRGWKLVGERKYCENPDPCPLALFSCGLSFDHPVTGERLRFEQKPPAVWPWTLCEELNSELK